MPSSTPASVATAPKIGLAWLVRLRWLAIAGQLAIVALAVLALSVSLPLPLVISLIAITASSNLGLTAWLRRLSTRTQASTSFFASEPSPQALTAVLVLDVLTLTLLLLCAGGASNPFSVFYLVHVALAALLLAPRHAWLVASLTSLAFGSLFVLPSHPIDAHAMHMQHGASSMHLQGMWLAYSLAAGFVVHFVSRVASALQARERELFELQRSAVRHEKLASLSTLAAGAAHELGTPLATIALVAKELERALETGKPADELIPDARLIRQEVERCRAILQQMAARAGEGAGEMLAAISVHGVEQSLSEALGARAAQIAFEREGELWEIVAPKQLLVQVLANLLRNAFDAQAEAGKNDPVRLVTRLEAEHAAFEIFDSGVGIPAHAQGRVGEPFFTTKPPGRGLGLGVFLARAFAEEMGGQLTLTARPGGGTVARLTLPRDMLKPWSTA
ncbi:MAG TPA: ATP-binding protein [Polyangiaceae bacterium]|nr:ATP-binding protein [Polyangiaceae bacterium]